MKTRKVNFNRTSDLKIESFAYGDRLNTVTVGGGDFYEVCYIVGGTGRVLNDDGSEGKSVGRTVYRGNFADKKPSTSVFSDGILTLSRGMTLLFFTAPETGVYTIKLDCSMLRFAYNCNIWYFKGNDEKGYSLIKIDGDENRHDPDKRQTFPCYITLEAGDSLVLGIGNYYGAVMKIFSLTAELEGGSKSVYTFPCPEFSMYDHFHSGNVSHLEKTGDGILCAPSQTVTARALPDRRFSVFSFRLSGNGAKQLVDTNYPDVRNGIFSYGYSQSLLELAPLLFLKNDPMSENIARIALNEILTFDSRTVKYNSYVERTKAAMLSSLRSPLRISDIAKDMNISDRYLYNLFIKYEGISPKQFLSNARLEKAKRMLSDSEASTTEIAEECGFADVLSFSHFFSRHAGISPSAFKRMKRYGGE